MKRLLAMVMSFLFAVSNNVGYTASEMPIFSPGSYYMFDDEESETIRELNNDINTNNERKLSQSFQVQPQCTPDGGHNKWMKSISSITNDNVAAVDNTNNTLTWTSEDQSMYIVCPEKCEVESVGDNGHTVTLRSTSGNYKFVFTGMSKTFTDFYRDEPEGGFTDSKDITGTILQAGDLVGIAKEGCTGYITSTSNSNKISFISYYYD